MIYLFNVTCCSKKKKEENENYKLKQHFGQISYLYLDKRAIHIFRYIQFYLHTHTNLYKYIYKSKSKFRLIFYYIVVYISVLD